MRPADWMAWARARRWSLIVLVAALLTGAGLAWWAVATRRPELAYCFVPGQRLVYELDYASASTSDLGGAVASDKEGPAPEQRFHASIQGQLALTVLAVQGERIPVVYQFENLVVRLASNGVLQLEAAEAITKDLRRPLFAEMDKHGRIRTLRLAPNANNLSSTVARSLLASLQFVLPEGRVAEWQAKEDDPNGEYTAAYGAERIEGKSGQWLIRKRKAVYHKQGARQGLSGQTSQADVTPEGALEAIVDTRLPTVVSVEGTETATVSLRGKEVAHVENILKFTLLRTETMAAKELAALGRQRRERERLVSGNSLFVLEDTDAGEQAIQMTELGEATAESLLADLARLEKVGPDEKRDQALYLKLKALAYLYPEKSPLLGQPLLRAGPRSPTMRLLALALASCGRPQAQSALVAVMRARLKDSDAMEQMIPVLAMANHPTTESEALLARLADTEEWSIRSKARLGLGAMARKLAATSPLRSRTIVQGVMRELEAARGPEERRLLLLVLGNVGAAESLALIRRCLAPGEGPEVRAAAGWALRFQAGVEAEADLCRSLTADPEASVRRAAVQALAFRPMSEQALAAHRHALQKDQSVAVRLEALSNLANVREHWAEAEKLLWMAASKDSSNDVRKAALVWLDAETAKEGTKQ